MPKRTRHKVAVIEDRRSRHKSSEKAFVRPAGVRSQDRSHCPTRNPRNGLDDPRRPSLAALEISPLGNAAREACPTGEDESVAAAVRRLLALHDEMTGSGTGDSERPPIAAALSAAYDKALHRDGTTIAQFRLERLLGEGGMGRVYLAQREIGGNVQRVALKIVPLAIRTPRLIGQPRRERAILAGLDHPHIARLIDAGELPDGHPYFAMECRRYYPLLRATATRPGSTCAHG